MNTITIIEKNSTSVEYTISEVNSLILMSRGIDYERNGDDMHFTIDLSEGWLFNVEDMLTRISGTQMISGYLTRY